MARKKKVQPAPAAAHSKPLIDAEIAAIRREKIRQVRLQNLAMRETAVADLIQENAELRAELVALRAGHEQTS